GKARRQVGAAVPLCRQGQPRDDRPLEGGRRHQGPATERLRRLGDLAAGAPLLSHRLPEPAARPRALDVQLPHARPGLATDHALVGPRRRRPRLTESEKREKIKGFDIRLAADRPGYLARRTRGRGLNMSRRFWAVAAALLALAVLTAVLAGRAAITSA